jgi:hypothetical protein
LFVQLSFFSKAVKYSNHLEVLPARFPERAPMMLAKKKRGKDSGLDSLDRQAWWLDGVSNYG